MIVLVFVGGICLLLGWYLLLAVLARVSLARKLRQMGCEQPPRYPRRDPILKTDLATQIKKGMKEGNIMYVARRNFRLYGKTFMARAMGKTILYTMDSDNIHAIVALEFDKFGVEPVRRPASEKWMGQGIFVTDGHTWDHARRTLKPVFQRAQIGELSVFERHVTNLMKLIPKNGSTVDLQSLFHRLVRKTFCFARSELQLGLTVSAQVS